MAWKLLFWVCAIYVSTTPPRGFEENVLVTHHPSHCEVNCAKRAKRKIFILGQQMKLVDKRVT